MVVSYIQNNNIMEQDIAKYWELANKVFQGKSSEKERTILLEWVDANPENQSIYNDFQKLYNATEFPEAFRDFNAQLDWVGVSGMMEETTEKFNRPATRLISFRNFLRIAAAVVLIISFIVVFNRQTTSDNYDQKEMQVFQTKSKQKDYIVLPDHSTVWLNKNSKLLYPNTFDGDQRIVYLSGEAYFDVEPNREKPFIIFSGPAKTEVLGTSFNLRAYDGEPDIQLTVVTGKVSFSLKDQKDPHAVIVQPGAMATLGRNRHKDIVLGLADKNLLAWKTNHLIFDNAPMQTMITTLNRYYTVVIKMENPSILNCHFTGDFKDMPLEKALVVITQATGLHYRLDNGVYILYGNGCNNQ